MGVIICLNGPPRSGKDTAAAAICERFSAFHYKMSYPLKVAVPAFLGLEDRKAELERHKDEPLPILFGKTYREVQIAMSEEFAKPLFGSAVFGSIAVQHLKGHIGPARMAVISDCGFKDELEPIAKFIGRKNILIVQLIREGCTFERDSRSYVELENVEMVQIHNKLDVEMFKQQIVRAVERWHDERMPPR